MRGDTAIQILESIKDMNSIDPQQIRQCIAEIHSLQVLATTCNNDILPLTENEIGYYQKSRWEAIKKH